MERTGKCLLLAGCSCRLRFRAQISGAGSVSYIFAARHATEESIAMTGIDWVILCLYFAFVLGIGITLKSSMKTSTDFFLAGRAIPAWVCGLAFISANLGAQEVI